MSNLVFFTVLSALWLAIAWLPYVLDRILVRGLMGALDNYNPDAKLQSKWAQRAMRAHTGAVEAFAAFAPLAVLAIIRIPDSGLAGTFAMTFFVGIVAHYIVYCLGVIVVRTLAFALAAFSTLGMALLLLGIL